MKGFISEDIYVDHELLRYFPFTKLENTLSPVILYLNQLGRIIFILKNIHLCSILVILKTIILLCINNKIEHIAITFYNCSYIKSINGVFTYANTQANTGNIVNLALL